MEQKVYVETSIVGYLTAKRSRDLLIAARQEATSELWSKLVSSRSTTYTSALVYQEAQQGDSEQAARRLEALASFAVLDIDQEAEALAEKVLAAKAIPAEYPDDALHVAIAAVNGVDVLLTWNFAHLNNPVSRMRIRRVVEDSGYQCPEVCSPEELLEMKP